MRFATTVVTAIFVATGCAGSTPPPQRPVRPTFLQAREKPVCVVLSVGGPNGLAHIGAVTALARAGRTDRRYRSMTVKCVVGNSMGALVGSLYATAPQADLSERYRGFIGSYEAETRREAAGNAGVGLLLGLLFTGGLGALPALLGGAAGAAMGASSTPILEHDRTVQVLDSYYAGAQIEELPLAFTTFYQETRQAKVVLKKEQYGNLADAVGRSIANPIVFHEFDPVEEGYLDPGTDRVSATPIEDACTLFPNSRILAVNVTGRPAFYQRDIRCPVMEVRVTVPQVNWERAARGQGADFDAVVEAGGAAMREALGVRGHARPRPRVTGSLASL